MKITDYPVIKKFTEDNVMLVDGNAGTKTITIADAIMAALDLMSPTNHRLVFRGKNLGSVVTTEQLAAIQAGTFEGLWLGDYWVINGITWRIADFDYWYGKGDSKCVKHHAVIIPDKSIGSIQMNKTATTDGGYIGSLAYTENLDDAKQVVANAFGDAIMSHRTYLCNAVTSGVPSNGAWCDSTVDLPNEYMMFGHGHYGQANSVSGTGNYDTSDAVQFALMAARPEYINIDTTWLRDIASAQRFSVVHNLGALFCCNADWSLGVRPVFAIG